jgi:hypothetical protein
MRVCVLGGTGSVGEWMTTFINPFCTAPSLMRPQEDTREPTVIKIEGCFTEDEMRSFYSEEE